MKILAAILGIVAIGLAANTTGFANTDDGGNATVAPGPKENGNNGNDKKNGNAQNNGNNGNDKENGNAQGEKKPKGKGHNE